MAMGGRNRVLVPVFAVVLGVLAIALTFLAYSKRIKEAENGPGSDGKCKYHSSWGFALGIMAAICLLSEQVLISAGTRCFCCCGVRFSSTCAIITSIILFVFSWLAFVIAFLGLIYSAILNNSSYLSKAYPKNNGDTCEVGRYNLYLGAALWCVISIVLSLLSYTFWVCGTSNRNHQDANIQASHVAMGQPHHLLQSKQ